MAASWTMDIVNHLARRQRRQKWCPAAGWRGVVRGTGIATPAALATTVLTSGLGAPSAHADVLDVLVDPIIVSLMDAATAGTVVADAGGATAAAAEVASSADPAAALDSMLAGVLNSINGAVTGAAAPPLPVEAGADPAAPMGLPSMSPETPDAFLEFVRNADGYAFTVEDDGLLYENHDIIGTVAMQINSGLENYQPVNFLAMNLVFRQILNHEWYSAVPVTTNFFEEFVTKEMNPDAFTASGLPTTPGNPVETFAYQADNDLKNTVYAEDLNLAALLLWPPVGSNEIHEVYAMLNELLGIVTTTTTTTSNTGGLIGDVENLVTTVDHLLGITTTTTSTTGNSGGLVGDLTGDLGTITTTTSTSGNSGGLVGDLTGDLGTTVDKVLGTTTTTTSTSGNSGGLVGDLTGGLNNTLNDLFG